MAAQFTYIYIYFKVKNKKYRISYCDLSWLDIYKKIVYKLFDTPNKKTHIVFLGEIWMVEGGEAIWLPYLHIYLFIYLVKSQKSKI